jgi:hypothetical protein
MVLLSEMLCYFPKGDRCGTQHRGCKCCDAHESCSVKELISLQIQPFMHENYQSQIVECMLDQFGL